MYILTYSRLQIMAECLFSSHNFGRLLVQLLTLWVEVYNTPIIHLVLQGYLDTCKWSSYTMVTLIRHLLSILVPPFSVKTKHSRIIFTSLPLVNDLAAEMRRNRKSIEYARPARWPSVSCPRAACASRRPFIDTLAARSRDVKFSILTTIYPI